MPRAEVVVKLRRLDRGGPRDAVALDGGNELRLALLPVADDRVALGRQERVLADVVEVAEPEQYRGDGAVLVLGLVAGKEEAESLLDRAASLPLDRHQVEVVAELRAAGDRIQLHCEQVTEAGDLQPANQRRRLEPALGSRETGAQKLEPCLPEEAVERACGALGDHNRAVLAEPLDQL